jgi:hypothetical protein
VDEREKRLEGNLADALKGSGNHTQAVDCGAAHALG